MVTPFLFLQSPNMQIISFATEFAVRPNNLARNLKKESSSASGYPSDLHVSRKDAHPTPEYPCKDLTPKFVLGGWMGKWKTASYTRCIRHLFGNSCVGESRPVHVGSFGGKNDAISSGNASLWDMCPLRSTTYLDPTPWLSFASVNSITYFIKKVPGTDRFMDDF